MQEQLSPNNPENEKNALKTWLCEVSLFDGKCCYKSKVSELRARLVTCIDISQSNSKDILKKFDERLWKKDGNIYEINSEELISLQDDVSRLNVNNIHDERKRFDLKKEIFVFTVNQSTLLALYAIVIIFVKMIWKGYGNVDFIIPGFSFGYLLAISLVLYVIDSSTKKLLIGLNGIVFFVLISCYLYSLYHQEEIIYLSFSDTVSLFFLILINLAMFGFYLFSSIYSITSFTNKNNKIPRIVLVLAVVAVYGILIAVTLQNISIKI
ncbi:hypothetical protein [Acinetobacter baumannii]|uniref:Uncharacterized protein n=1 Tax=Acinetobacter baumannii TaxID=470 RepID=A0AAP1W754_ACIBA|nr:hypothetical protein [Acinetobacter baumannii]MBD2850097.1 hypothetical protein [Acinetobacter baumannii]MBD3134452.1 hypothetical protein [Acinetobacter baumannii]MBE0307362.1 hypothetical protein [Acinetobacter baumannii]MBE0313336.1 hypothetical protein [Acinetobacter baumannii]MBE0330392.1 hypothetical protein [Acinetobacter baumannii]